MNCAVVAMVALAAGCGRVWFEPRPDGDTGVIGDDDAELAGDSGDPPPCVHTFCENFDRDPPINAGWYTMETTAGVAWSLTTDGFVSAPQAGRLELPASNEAGWLDLRLLGVTTSVVIRLQLGWETSNPGTAEVDLVQVHWETPSGACSSSGYYLVRDGTGPFNLQETYSGCGGGNVNNYFTNLDNSGFHDVVMTITFGALNAARIKLEIDGTAVLDKLTTQPIEPSNLMLKFGGAGVRNIVTPWLIRYDDIFIDAQ